MGYHAEYNEAMYIIGFFSLPKEPVALVMLSAFYCIIK